MMLDSNVIKAKVAELLRVDPMKVQDDTIVSDLVADSFALVEMVVELQEQTGIRLMQKDLQGVRTVGDLTQVMVRLSTAA